MKTLQLVAIVCFCLLFKNSYAETTIELKYVSNQTIVTSAEPQFFIIDSWISGFGFGFFSDSTHRFKNAWKRANLTAANDVKIWGGLFVSDPNKKFFGRVWETVSRVTYQSPQTLVGLVYGHFENTFGGNVELVCYKYGATVLQGRHYLFYEYGGTAVTLGSYIVGHPRTIANCDNAVFQHEFGHYLQSQAMGIAYLGRIGIPNIRSEHGNYKQFYSNHDFHPTEQDANRRSFLYFNSRIPEFQNDSSYTGLSWKDTKGWDYYRNPISIGDSIIEKMRKYKYISYQKAIQSDTLKTLSVHPKWYDYVFPIFSGFYNAYDYNH